MPRIVLDAFLDPSNTASSIAASPSRAINEYLESVAPGHGKSSIWSVRTPGLHLFASFFDGPIRGVFQINGRMFAVGGGYFGEVQSDGTCIHPFAVDDDGQPVSMASSGTASHQILVTSAGAGYVYDLLANTLTAIADVNFPNNVLCCEFFNGFFFVLNGVDSRQFQWSAAEDATTWPALNFAQTESPDNLTSLIRNHTELWLIGSRTSSVWYATQDANNPYAPMQGVWIEQGGQGVFTPQRIDNTLMWMGLGENGQGMVFKAGGGGYTPQRVSTFAVEQDLQTAETPTDARAFAFQLRGHIFYALVLPRNTTTWLYDVTMDRWTEWATWNSTTCEWIPSVAGCHVFCFNRHYVGSRFDASIYELSLDFFDDQITAIA